MREGMNPDNLKRIAQSAQREGGFAYRSGRVVRLKDRDKSNSGPASGMVPKRVRFILKPYATL